MKVTLLFLCPQATSRSPPYPKRSVFDSAPLSPQSFLINLSPQVPRCRKAPRPHARPHPQDTNTPSLKHHRGSCRLCLSPISAALGETERLPFSPDIRVATGKPNATRCSWTTRRSDFKKTLLQNLIKVPCV